MDTTEYIRDLVTRFRKVLDERSKQLECFCRYGVQVEGWLKGELLFFFDSEKAAGRLVNVDREVQLGAGPGKKRVDFRLEIPVGVAILDAWIEVKHWLIGHQKGSKYNAVFYFGDVSSVGIKPAVETLTKVRRGSKYLLVLATANPAEDDWSNGVTKFNDKFPHLHLKALTNPTEFPKSYFLGLLEFSPNAQRQSS